MTKFAFESIQNGDSCYSSSALTVAALFLASKVCLIFQGQN